MPPLLKTPVVTPTPKQTPPDSIENGIRPISLTCQIAKLKAGFTLTRIMPLIANQLDNKQFSMARKSTQQAIVYILHLALEALDKRGVAQVHLMLRYIYHMLNSDSSTSMHVTWSHGRKQPIKIMPHHATLRSNYLPTQSPLKILNKVVFRCLKVCCSIFSVFSRFSL